MRKCRAINQETGLSCLKDATYAVVGLDGKVCGKGCPEHGKELEILLHAAHGMVTNHIVSKN